ncbi:hypothetical protein EJB05_27730 [Eragrostis curvula]|uniref:Uncharacterized protein n=1 Tax=Eragrostis curvula TaxID=38414 RepID=A0A5J9UQB6_9POAL|nr:hypothetical protein EJB05_27730 [Eragrostis curvula]
MEPGKDPSDGLATQPIEVDGFMSLVINPTSVQMPYPSKLSYHRGIVKSGSTLDKVEGCRSTVLEMVKECAEELYSSLIQFAHPCVIKILGHANRIKEDNCSHTYLALEIFESTFAVYTRKQGPATDQNGRFTEEFIALIREQRPWQVEVDDGLEGAGLEEGTGDESARAMTGSADAAASDVVHGMEELHSMHHCCPVLKDDDIAVIRKGDSASAKIWRFKKCVAGKEERQKDGDWVRLGVMMFEVGWNDESRDLVDQMRRGKLKGRSILKHSALLTVRKKFQNVLELNFHISVYYPEESNQDKSNEDESKDELDVSELCAANLNTYLDKKLVWSTPGWMNAPVTKQTLRGFVKQLRIVFEHEVKHIPPKLTKEDISQLKKEKDLDHSLQASCGNIIRAVHMLVNELKLNN